VKKLAVLLVSLAFAAGALAQTPAPDTAQAPVKVAQAEGSAGGAAQGAAVPAASTGGGTAGIVAIIAVGVAAIASVTAYSSTTSAPTNH
jgi:hypothetical protein